jgi:hypothetical protein
MPKTKCSIVTREVIRMLGGNRSTLPLIDPRLFHVLLPNLLLIRQCLLQFLQTIKPSPLTLRNCNSTDLIFTTQPLCKANVTAVRLETPWNRIDTDCVRPCV